MRFVAPARSAVDPAVFARPPLREWMEFEALLCGVDWPGVAALEAQRDKVVNAANVTLPHFVEQTPALLRDGLHYEQRIAERGVVATRADNWHDLLNALVWLRHPALKTALNARQIAEIAKAGPKRRTRAQCALTHFDEAGVVVMVRDPILLDAWDAHDWHRLFWRERAAWLDGRIEVVVFGHALLEHALRPAQMLTGKALVVRVPQNAHVENVTSAVATAIGDGSVLDDPQELRPLPLTGIPDWHSDNVDEDFYRTAECFRPLRKGRRYPPALSYCQISA